jgi:hypothetical protein
MGGQEVQVAIGSSVQMTEIRDFTTINRQQTILVCLSTDQYWFLVVAFSLIAGAQEVKFVDLSLVRAALFDQRHGRTVKQALRWPGVWRHRYRRRWARTDAIHMCSGYLPRVSPTDIDPAKPFEVELRVL